MLYEFSDIIAFNINELELINLAEISITLKDDIPVHHRPYRLSYS